MFRSTIAVFFLLTLLMTCSKKQGDDPDERPVRDPRSGNPADLDQLEEDISFLDSLKNCKSDASAPDNVIDMGLRAFKIQDKYPMYRIRECLKSNLNDIHNQICSNRDALERQRQNADSESERISIESSLHRLDELQYKFVQKLYNQAYTWDERAQRFDSKKSGSGIGRFFNWMGKEESEALRDILNAESYRECNSYYNREDEDRYRYDRDYGNNSYNRRRSY